jgi:hypothetical protein
MGNRRSSRLFKPSMKAKAEAEAAASEPEVVHISGDEGEDEEDVDSPENSISTSDFEFEEHNDHSKKRKRNERDLPEKRRKSSKDNDSAYSEENISDADSNNSDKNNVGNRGLSKLNGNDWMFSLNLKSGAGKQEELKNEQKSKNKRSPQEASLGATLAKSQEDADLAHAVQNSMQDDHEKHEDSSQWEAASPFSVETSASLSSVPDFTAGRKQDISVLPAQRKEEGVLHRNNRSPFRSSFLLEAEKRSVESSHVQDLVSDEEDMDAKEEAEWSGHKKGSATGQRSDTIDDSDSDSDSYVGIRRQGSPYSAAPTHSSHHRNDDDLPPHCRGDACAKRLIPAFNVDVNMPKIAARSFDDDEDEDEGNDVFSTHESEQETQAQFIFESSQEQRGKYNDGNRNNNNNRCGESSNNSHNSDDERYSDPNRGTICFNNDGGGHTSNDAECSASEANTESATQSNSVELSPLSPPPSSSNESSSGISVGMGDMNMPGSIVDLT